MLDYSDTKSLAESEKTCEEIRYTFVSSYCPGRNLRKLIDDILTGCHSNSRDMQQGTVIKLNVWD